MTEVQTLLDSPEFPSSVEPVLYEGHPHGKEDQRIALVFQQIMNGSVPLFGPSQMSEGTLRAPWIDLSISAARIPVEPA